MIIGIAVSHLPNVLEKYCYRCTSRPDRTAFFGEVQNRARVWEFIQNELDFNLQVSALTVSIGISDEPDKQETEEKRAQELEGIVLVRHNAEVCALFFSRQFQINFIIGRDVADQLCLHDL